MIRFLLVAIALLCAAPERVAADAPHAATRTTCTRSPLPKRICQAVSESRRPAWATNRDLAYILRRESGFDRCAVNPGRHDCAYHGSASCGLFQLQPCRCFPTVKAEVRCGVAYIVQRYRSPERAAEHERANGWY